MTRFFQNQNIRIALLLFVLLFISLAPFVSVAQSQDCSQLSGEARAQCVCQNFSGQFNIKKDPASGNVGGNLADEMPKYCTITQLMSRVIQIALAIAGTVAVVFIIIGGFQYLSSAGNDEQAEKGRKTLMNAVIGLVVIILASVIVRIVVNTLTGDIFGAGFKAPATTPAPAGSGGTSGTGNAGGTPSAGTDDQGYTLQEMQQAALRSSVTPMLITDKASNTDTIQLTIQASPNDRSIMCNEKTFDNLKNPNYTLEVFINGSNTGNAFSAIENKVAIPMGTRITEDQEITVTICGNQLGDKPTVVFPLVPGPRG